MDGGGGSEVGQITDVRPKLLIPQGKSEIIIALDERMHRIYQSKLQEWQRCSVHSHHNVTDFPCQTKFALYSWCLHEL